MADQEIFQRRQDGVLKRTSQRVIHGLDHTMGRHSLVGDEPIFSNDAFPWAKALEANWRLIRQELDAVLAFREALPNFQDITKDVRSITRDDKWKTYFFYGMGQKAEGNCRRCPETTRLIEQVPGMTTAFFSILAPGKHIPAHRGPYKGVIRYHLGLKVPEPNEQCRIRVHDQIAHWEEGRSIIFDDTYEHEVWNDTDGERAILFLDVLRPLPPRYDLLNRSIIKLFGKTPIVTEGQRNQALWDMRLQEAMEQQAQRVVPAEGQPAARA